MATEKILAQALRLPRRDRARVAQELLDSLEEPTDDVAAAWAAELERRSVAFAEGSVQTVSWEDARAEVMRDLRRRRARRALP